MWPFFLLWMGNFDPFDNLLRDLEKPRDLVLVRENEREDIEAAAAIAAPIAAAASPTQSLAELQNTKPLCFHFSIRKNLKWILQFSG